VIRIENLTKSFRTPHGRKVVIDNLSLILPTGKSLGLLGRNGAGKSTLLEIIAGLMPPDSGRIVSDGTISWPVGLGSSLHPELTGAQNVRFIARIYGIDGDSLCRFVQAFAELGDHFHMRLRTYSSGMRSRLAFGASMGIPFDTYLIDETTAVGDASFRAKSRVLFRQRMQNAGAIMVNHNLTELKEYCDSGLVLEHGKVQYFDDIEEAIAVHKRMMKS
jgi:capsular polysaccharide transport system ATP-binding protein